MQGLLEGKVAVITGAGSGVEATSGVAAGVATGFFPPLTDAHDVANSRKVQIEMQQNSFFIVRSLIEKTGTSLQIISCDGIIRFIGN